LRARLYVPGKGARIMIAHVGSRESRLVPDASLVFLGKYKTGDYHDEMNSYLWLNSLGEEVLEKLQGGALVVERAPYHLQLIAETLPASSKMRKVEFVAWLERHEAAPDGWSLTWRHQKTVPELRAQAEKHRATPCFRVQDLAAVCDMSVIFSPVAQPDVSAIEMVWATVSSHS